MMTRAEVLRKCLIVFDALRRVSSKGNAGLEAVPGAEESFRADAEICKVLREWLREMESGAIRGIAVTKEKYEELERGFRTEIEAPQMYTLGDMLQGNPLMTQETIQAARRVDEARDRIIDQIGRPEPDVPKVVELKEWQKLKNPPERRVDEARDRIIDQIGRPEPDVPKVVELKEWQKLKNPPERLDFDEE